MKKIAWICLMLLCWGCAPSMGTITEDSLNLEMLSDTFDEKIANQEWQINVLGEPLSPSQIEVIYGISETQYEAAMVRRSVVEAAGEEIAVFHAAEGQGDQIVEQLGLYQNERLTQNEGLPYQQGLIQNAHIRKIGNYVVFVCSQVQANVIQYINSLA